MTTEKQIAIFLVPKTYRAVPRWTDKEEAALKSWQAKIDARRAAEESLQRRAQERRKK